MYTRPEAICNSVMICIQVRVLLDENFVRHDTPGYSNPIITPGDRILKVDDMHCENVSVETLHRMLSGVVHTPVKISLARISDGTPYNVTVLRHKYHEEDVRARAEAESHKLHAIEGAFVGIKVSGAPPHVVLAVNALGFLSLACDVGHGHVGYERRCP